MLLWTDFDKGPSEDMALLRAGEDLFPYNYSISELPEIELVINTRDNDENGHDGATSDDIQGNTISKTLVYHEEI